MNFKTLSIILAIAMVASNAYFLSQPSQTESSFNNEKGENFTLTQKDVNDLFNFMDPLTVEDSTLLLLWKQKSAIMDSTSGTPFSPVDAAHKLKEFKDWNTQTGNLIRKIKPHGFAFGKNRIRNLLKEIDNINRQETDSDKKIYGVRAYLTLTPRPNEPKRHYLDLMLVPIKQDGTPYHDLFNKALTQTTTSDALLNTSLPCPDQCNE